jgi:3-oxoacyl-[acyl-carrier-protein] synthase II
MTREVVITGVGAVTPLGNRAGDLHHRWLAGERGIDGGLARCRAFVADEHLSRKDARRADRFTQLAIVAAAEAIEQAGGELAGPRTGCVLGTGIGGLATIEEALETYERRGPERVSPLAVPSMMSNAAPAAIALRHGLTGPVFGTVSACAAGAHAIGTALALLRGGAADAIVTGGAEAAITPLSLAGFGALEAMSPTGESRPFDARRDGFVMGEGAGVLVLETAEHAAARGAVPLARLTGFGSTCDAHHLTAPREDGAAAAEAIRLALADAGVAPGEVSYVNAHGTSTPLNDAAETRALKAALGSRAHEIPVSSTKSVIGHLLGAAGAVEAVATTLALQHRVAGPTVGWEQPEEGLDLDYVPDGPRPLTGDRLVALSNSFGFGGHNAVLCLESC